MDFPTWLGMVDNSLSSSGHPLTSSSYNLQSLQALFSQGVSPVIAARMVANGQVPQAPPPLPAAAVSGAPKSAPLVSPVERSGIEFGRRFCVYGGWMMVISGGILVTAGLLMLVGTLFFTISIFSLVGFTAALVPLLYGVLSSSIGGVLLVFGYGSRLLLDIHESICASRTP